MKADDLDLEGHMDVADRSYYPTVIVSCAVLLASYRYVCPLISETCSPVYKTLPKKTKIDWDSRINSNIHAVIVSVSCLYCFLYDEEIYKDPIWGDSVWVRHTCAIVYGYMLYDSIILFIYYKEIGDVFYVFHHGAALYGYYFVITYSTLCWFANVRLIAEFSTIFVNQRWFFDTAGCPRSSLRFILNGAAMALMFLLARIFTIPMYWGRIWSIAGTPGAASLRHVWYVMIVTSAILDGINVFWMYKICRAFTKVLLPALTSRSSSSSSSSSSSNSSRSSEKNSKVQ